MSLIRADEGAAAVREYPNQHAYNEERDHKRDFRRTAHQTAPRVPLSFVFRESQRKLLRRLGKCRQLGDVRRLMLDDHLGAKVARDPVEAVVARQRAGAIGVERGHATVLHLLGEVVLVAGQKYRSAWKVNQQRGVTRRVTWHREHHHAAIAEYVGIARDRNDLASAAEPGGEVRPRVLQPLVIPFQSVPICTADRQLRPRKWRAWPVCSPWKWLIPMNLIWAGVTPICLS